MSQPITAAPVSEAPFGLAQAIGVGVDLPASDPLDPDGRWLKGYGAEGPACGTTGLTTTPDTCDDPDVIATPLYLPDDFYMPRWSYQYGKPFRIEAGVKCSTFGAGSDIVADFSAAAQRHLDLIRWNLIAYELWTGTKVPANRRLASPDATVLAPQPVSPMEGISLLEDYFSSAVPGGQRVIHCPTRAVPYLDFKGIIHAQGTRFYTALRSLVVVDDGYPGTGPDGLAPEPTGTVWLYGTGPLTARLDPKVHVPEVDLADAVRPGNNDVRVRAQQIAAISWLCGHAAVQIITCE